MSPRLKFPVKANNSRKVTLSNQVLIKHLIETTWVALWGSQLEFLTERTRQRKVSQCLNCPKTGKTSIDSKKDFKSLTLRVQQKPTWEAVSHLEFQIELSLPREDCPVMISIYSNLLSPPAMWVLSARSLSSSSAWLVVGSQLLAAQTQNSNHRTLKGCRPSWEHQVHPPRAGNGVSIWKLLDP